MLPPGPSISPQCAHLCVHCCAEQLQTLTERTKWLLSQWCAQTLGRFVTQRSADTDSLRLIMQSLLNAFITERLQLPDDWQATAVPQAPNASDLQLGLHSAIEATPANV